jgi:hypothetical protein
MACLGAVIVRDSADTEGRATTGDRMTPPDESLDCRCRSVWGRLRRAYGGDTSIPSRGRCVSTRSPASKHPLPSTISVQSAASSSSRFRLPGAWRANSWRRSAFMPLLIVADVTKPGLRDATIRQISKYVAGAFAYAHVSGRYSAYSRRAAVTHDRGDTGWSSVSAEVRRNRPGARLRAR